MVAKDIYPRWFFIACGISFGMSLLVNFKPQIIPSGVIGLMSRVLVERIAPLTFEFSFYSVPVLVGYAGYFYAVRSIPERKLPQTLLLSSLRSIDSLGGLFAGIMLGSTVFWILKADYEAVKAGVVLTSYVVLFSMMPALMARVVLAEKEIRRANIFYQKPFARLFRLLCLAMIALGVAGYVSMVLRFAV